MILRTDTTKYKQSEPGDFEARVVEESLFVPQDIAGALERLAVRTPEEFVSFAMTFPSALASELGWSVGDVVHARDALIAQLRGVMIDQLLDSPPGASRSYGALNPAVWLTREADREQQAGGAAGSAAM